MYLVDTSVWIDYINGNEARHVKFLDELLANPLAVGLSELIYMEVLQGASNQQVFDQFVQYFSGQVFYELRQDQYSYQTSAQLYVDCRRKGIIIRSSVDCLIAQCAIENDLILMHNDKDFQQLAALSTLKQKSFL